jgi:hypothetical protein
MTRTLAAGREKVTMSDKKRKKARKVMRDYGKVSTVEGEDRKRVKDKR